MMIYPTIELQGGRCVTLHRGRLDAPQVWHVDPVAMARSFAVAGASWMHVTDFDAVARHGETNEEIIRDIIRQAGIPVQVGGGMRTMERIAQWIDWGAGRVVIGTTAVWNPELVKEAAKAYPDQIVLAVDVYQGHVMTGGWTETSAYEPLDFIATFENDPLAAIIVTDIDADIEETDATVSLITRLADAARQPVIARGTIRGVDDISTLKYVPHVAGTIISRALFDKSVDLADALALAQPEPEETAPFI